jgi:hypothetical protein
MITSRLLAMRTAVQTNAEATFDVALNEGRGADVVQKLKLMSETCEKP